MGTKSKNNETKKPGKRERMPGLLAAAVLILAATLVFLSQYPGFKERATEEEPNILASNEFLHEIYQANIVLYKQLCDWKSSLTESGEEASGEDVFLSAEIARAKDYNEFFTFDGDTPLSFAGEQLDELLSQWDISMQNGLAQQLDYEIMDRESGRTFANTERALHLLGTEEGDAYLDGCYPYYIKMDFDENGLLEHVWVRGEDADTLVKSVQRVMQSRYLERSLYESLYYSPYGGIDWEDTVYYGVGNAVMQMDMEVLNTPKNCTVCYALTEAQLNEVKTSSRLFLSMSSAGNYLNSGIQDVFRILLIILGTAALLLPLWKKYHLHESHLLPLHMEVLAVLVFATFLILGELSATLVLYSMSDSWEYSLPYMLRAAFLVGVPLTAVVGTRTIVWIINLLLLTMAFALWFALVTAFGQVYVFGIRGYVRKRCFCYRLFRYIRASVRRKRARIRREFLHMDLEQNMNVPLFKLLLANFLVLSFISMFWVLGVFLLIPYTVFLYGQLRKYIRIIQGQYAQMLTAASSVAAGNLQTEIEGDWGMFSAFQEELSSIQTEFSRAVEEEVKSQRMRTELITNVSHDLKTPLTAIITYTELLQEEGVTETQRKEYLEVLQRKSLRLKTLIEDLFEVSKANSGNVAFHTEKVDICHLVRQMYLEYEDRAKDAGLIFRFQFPQQKVFLMLDGEKTSRIFDNLYTNIIKYAMPDTRVYVSVEQVGDEVRIELKNISGYELNIPAESLTDRFVRGDSARSSEGSGLGLAIARSFVELQGGKMELEIDGDLFKVLLIWKGL